MTTRPSMSTTNTPDRLGRPGFAPRSVHESDRESQMEPPKDLDQLHDDVERRLAAAGQRYTDGRRALVSALATAQRPLTLRDIVSTVPEVPQSSAYRNLDALRVGGIVVRISAGGDRAHFELAETLLGHHHHLICVSCGTIEDMRIDGALEAEVDRALTGAAGEAGFTPLRHSLDLYGECSDCGDEA
ncbi:MAG: transcriptional repressor [Acidimicrobiales bacterium]|nr:transcriptional repressor [Acidimicrobiales bacterium]MYD83198.1 transcriptional repressor [Acidimicrobiales bacterium]MYJ64021.1 transcriptional repressor [Acidimicrobiales bacterium]